MASWRESTDPRCPECDGPLSATASYCMHCGVELPMDDSADVSDADDVTYGTDSGSGTTAVVDDGDATDDGVLASLRGLLTFTKTVDVSDGTVEAGDYTETDTPHSGGAQRGRSTRGRRQRSHRGSRQGRLPRGGRVPEPTKASLTLRAPTAFVVSLPIAFALLFIVLPSVGQLSGSLAGLVWFAAWIGSIASLVRKPLPSDIIGDAFYVYAVIVLAIPILIGLALALQTVLNPASSDNTIGELVILVVIMEFTFAIPAGILAAIGAVANWWAKRKLSRDGRRRGRSERR